jgi:hypothetical protein
MRQEFDSMGSITGDKFRKVESCSAIGLSDCGRWCYDDRRLSSNCIKQNRQIAVPCSEVDGRRDLGRHR